MKSDHFQKFFDTGSFGGGNFADHGLSTPLFGGEAKLLQLAFDFIEIGVGQIDFIHCDHDGDFGGLGVAKSFEGLGFNPVIRGDNQNDDVGDGGSTGAHGGKGFVAWGIKKSDGRVITFNGVGPDVLGDAARFARGDFGLANGVEQ